MIITRTPFRISLFGGGSDYPKWYRQHGGAVIGFALDKYCYISARPLPPFFEHRHRIVYSAIELVKEFDEIKHPSVRTVLKQMKVSHGIEIHHHGDLPARSGLGSSSSFTVGLLNALNALNGQLTTKRYLAEEAIRIEQDCIGEAVGSQDQVWAAYGGMNRIDFHRDETFSVAPIIMDKNRREELLGSLLLFFTGVSRYSTDVSSKKIENIDRNFAPLSRLVEMVDEAEATLSNPNTDLGEIGRLLHESWRLKRGLADNVSSDFIDEIYAEGRAAGAVGGKLLGAGGGGFLLFFADKSLHQDIRERLRDLIEVRVGVDIGGSKIVVYEPDGLESR
jgi:D-glycero-alpha-D-manno-heptose-7-phosphate kinase